MATIVRKKDSYCVVYRYTDKKGKQHQRWETFKTSAEAKKRKAEIEFDEAVGTITVTTFKDFAELLNEYVTVYGRQKWAPSTYSSNTGLIEHYIIPYLGKKKIDDITTRVIDNYYKMLLTTEAVATNQVSKKGRLVSPHTVKDIHKIIRGCFNQAKKWEVVEKNPADNATLPKSKSQKREIWTAETLFEALKVCDDPKLSLALNLSFCCSLRIGEMLALTWDCVDVSDEAIEMDSAYLIVNKELQRLDKESVENVELDGVMVRFPGGASNKTVLVLKTPKTESSIRKVFIPKTVAKMLRSWKEGQDEEKEFLGDMYHDYGLVFASVEGKPVDSSSIRKSLNRLIQDHGFPQIVFHSLRHASVTYKLKLNGGDIKAVQGDTGHAQSQMVSDVYSHILDESRKQNAMLFEQEYYSKPEVQETPKPAQPEAAGGIDADTLQKILANPQAVALLAALAKTL